MGLKDRVYCIWDCETFSEVDLKEVGAYEYSMHPSTEVLCVAFRIGTRANLHEQQTHTWSPLAPSFHIQLLLDAFQNSNVKLVAQNAMFEQLITRNVLARKLHTQAHYLAKIPVFRWICTAAQSAALALPRKLEGAGSALGLAVQKDMAGHRLMLKMSKPRKPSKLNPSTRHKDPEDLKRLIAYCATDVDTTVELFLTLPPLSRGEREIWCLDQVINQRGFRVDRKTVKTAMRLVTEEKQMIERQIAKLTDGEVTTATQGQRILAWLEANECFLPDLKEKTVSDAIASGLATGECRRLLRYRQRGSRTSTKKYWALEARSRVDGRVRDSMLYHGASTGRWTGAGVQPHNFPRGKIKNALQATEVIAEGNFDTLKMLYGDPGETLASCLRNMIIPSKGRTFHVADYNAIEARVLFWVADHEEGVKAFKEGRDLYVEQASYAFGIPAKKIADDSFERFIGKGLILGCGYGMGFKKFVVTCKGQGKTVPEELAKGAVDSYRTLHRPVVLLWKKLEMAAMAAVENVGKRYEINHTKWWVKGRFLWCELPSGRRLAYADPSISWEKPSWGGDKIKVLYHWGVDSKTKRWVKQKTWGGTLTENVIQAIARDLLAAALVRIEKSDGLWQISFHVHDEAAAEFDPVLGEQLGVGLDDFCDLMSELPDWATGLPVKVKGWEGKRYKK